MTPSSETNSLTTILPIAILLRCQLSTSTTAREGETDRCHSLEGCLGPAAGWLGTASAAPQRGLRAKTISVSPGQSQKSPSGDRDDSRARTSVANASARSPNRCGAAQDRDR